MLPPGVIVAPPTLNNGKSRTSRTPDATRFKGLAGFDFLASADAKSGAVAALESSAEGAVGWAIEVDVGVSVVACALRTQALIKSHAHSDLPIIRIGISLGLRAGPSFNQGN